jgi:hypothetical protein
MQVFSCNEIPVDLDVFAIYVDMMYSEQVAVT